MTRSAAAALRFGQGQGALVVGPRGAPSLTAAIVVTLDAFEVPGVPEIAKRDEAQRLARLALMTGDHPQARRLAEEANRYAHLARVRLAARREGGAR